MYRATGSLTEIVAGIGSTLSRARRQTSLTAAPIYKSSVTVCCLRKWIPYRGIRVSSRITVGRSITAEGNHIRDRFTINQVGSSDSSLSSDVNLSTETVVDLDEVSNGTGVGMAIPLVIDVISSIFLDEVIAFDLMRKIRIQLLVNVEDLVVPLKLLGCWILDRGFS
jgi:hypothetical protein